MHMSDALLSPAIGGAMYVVSAGSIAYAIKKVEREFDQSELPLMAVSGAFVFAAQMINFTIPGTGSSGHIGGGILLAGLLGGTPALLTLAAVLIIQCLLFADGGLLALGANIFNMGVIPCLIVYPLIFKAILKKGVTRKRLTIASVLAAVVGLQLGAFGVVLETVFSGVTSLPFGTFVLFMQPIHLAIGLVEGVITAAVLNFVYALQPEILNRSLGITGATVDEEMNRKANRKVFALIAILAVLVGGGLSLFASSYPDGLEWSVANVDTEGALEAAEEEETIAGSIQESTAIMPDYDYKEGTEGVVNGTTTAGLVGALITFLFAGVIGFGLRAVKKSTLKKNGRYSK